MKLHELHPAPGSSKKPHRKGRGAGSKWGKTAGRGQDGQKSRSGGGVRPGFEGGQLPLIKRIPKRGFSNARYKKVYTEVNVSSLNAFDAGTVVNAETLKEAGIISKFNDGIKILGKGDLDVELTVQATKFSKSAQEKIEAKGGKVEVV